VSFELAIRTVCAVQSGHVRSVTHHWCWSNSEHRSSFALLYRSWNFSPRHNTTLHRKFGCTVKTMQ